LFRFGVADPSFYKHDHAFRLDEIPPSMVEFITGQMDSLIFFIIFSEEFD